MLTDAGGSLGLAGSPFLTGSISRVTAAVRHHIWHNENGIRYLLSDMLVFDLGDDALLSVTALLVNVFKFNLDSGTKLLRLVTPRRHPLLRQRDEHAPLLQRLLRALQRRRKLALLHSVNHIETGRLQLPVRHLLIKEVAIAFVAVQTLL